MKRKRIIQIISVVVVLVAAFFAFRYWQNKKEVIAFDTTIAMNNSDPTYYLTIGSECSEADAHYKIDQGIWYYNFLTENQQDQAPFNNWIEISRICSDSNIIGHLVMKHQKNIRTKKLNRILT